MKEENLGTILIADDYAEIRDLNKDFTKVLFPSYVVEIFPDGNSLRERLQKGPDGIVAVVTDNEMPGVNGIKIIKDFAREYSGIVFVLSYGGDREIGEEALRNGAAFYVEKPEAPIPKLKEYFERKAQEKAA